MNTQESAAEHPPQGRRQVAVTERCACGHGRSPTSKCPPPWQRRQLLGYSEKRAWTPGGTGLSLLCSVADCKATPVPSPLSPLVSSCLREWTDKRGVTGAPWHVPRAPSSVPQPVIWEPEGRVRGNASVLCLRAETKLAKTRGHRRSLAVP